MTCIDLLKKEILPKVNMFSYGQVESPYGSGQFIKDLREHFGETDNVVVTEIETRTGSSRRSRTFLGKGK